MRFSGLAAHGRDLGLALLLARTRVGSGLFAGFFLAHVVAHGTTDRGAGHAVFPGNVPGDTADHGAFQATGLSTGNAGQGQHQRQGSGN